MEEKMLSSLQLVNVYKQLMDDILVWHDTQNFRCLFICEQGFLKIHQWFYYYL